MVASKIRIVSSGLSHDVQILDADTGQRVFEGCVDKIDIRMRQNAPNVAIITFSNVELDVVADAQPKENQIRGAVK